MRPMAFTFLATFIVLNTTTSFAGNASKPGFSATAMRSCDYLEFSRTRVSFVARQAYLREGNPATSEETSKRFWASVESGLGCKLESLPITQRLPSSVCAPVLTCPERSLAIDFCGEGKVKRDKNKPFDKVGNVSECLNDACCWHDHCYTENCITRKECIWTPQSKATGCDGALVTACDARIERGIPQTMPPLTEVRIGNCCDVVGTTKLIRDNIVCELVYVFNIDKISEEVECRNAVGVGCDEPEPVQNFCLSIFADKPFPIQDNYYTFTDKNSFTVNFLSGSWSCDPSLGLTSWVGYANTKAGNSAPVPLGNLCSLIGCVGDRCRPEPVALGTTFTRTSGGPQHIFLGPNDSNTGDNTEYLHICGYFH